MTDEEQIRRLLGRWAQAYDDKDAARWTALFVDNGRFAVDRPERNHVGRAEIRSFIDTQIARSAADRHTKHMCGNPVIRFTSPDAADAEVDFVVYSSSGGAAWSATSIGRYLNKLVRQDGEWYFLENVVTARHDEPVSGSRARRARSADPQPPTRTWGRYSRSVPNRRDPRCHPSAGRQTCPLGCASTRGRKTTAAWAGPAWHRVCRIPREWHPGAPAQRRERNAVAGVRSRVDRRQSCDVFGQVAPVVGREGVEDVLRGVCLACTRSVFVRRNQSLDDRAQQRDLCWSRTENSLVEGQTSTSHRR